MKIKEMYERIYFLSNEKIKDFELYGNFSERIRSSMVAKIPGLSKAIENENKWIHEMAKNKNKNCRMLASRLLLLQKIQLETELHECRKKRETKDEFERKCEIQYYKEMEDGTPAVLISTVQYCIKQIMEDENFIKISAYGIKKNDIIIHATKKLYGKNKKYIGEIVVSIGRPNYKDRKFIKGSKTIPDFVIKSRNNQKNVFNYAYRIPRSQGMR